LPTVHFGNNGFIGGDDMILKCAVNTIKNGGAKLADFLPYRQKQIKPYLEGGALYTIGNDELPHIIQSVNTYLLKYVQMFGIKGYEKIISNINDNSKPAYEQLELIGDDTDVK
jgi:hypothetical protein